MLSNQKSYIVNRQSEIKKSEFFLAINI